MGHIDESNLGKVLSERLVGVDLKWYEVRMGSIFDGSVIHLHVNLGNVRCLSETKPNSVRLASA